MPAGACQTGGRPPTVAIAPPHGLPAFVRPPLAAQAGARLQPVDPVRCGGLRDQANELVQGQIVKIYLAGQNCNGSSPRYRQRTPSVTLAHEDGGCGGLGVGGVGAVVARRA